MTVEAEYTYKWMEVMGYQSEISGAMTRELYHMIVASYFEVVRHEFDREDAGHAVTKQHRCTPANDSDGKHDASSSVAQIAHAVAHENLIHNVVKI